MYIPEIGVDWDIDDPILSGKDKKNPLLKDLRSIY